MAMFKAPEYFSAGVSGAPVTEWALYDTHYTERYLGHPQLNKTGYQASSVFSYVEGLKGPILIYHGMADDNVLFTHSTKLYKTLQDANKQFEIGAYPGSKHSMRGKSVKIHLDTSIIQFFERHFNSVPKQL
jgi:dipeptidyl-peptidase-4